MIYLFLSAYLVNLAILWPDVYIAAIYLFFSNTEHNVLFNSSL